MDDFDFGIEPTELATSAFNINFGTGGKITHMWVNDLGTPMGADLQMVSGPIQMGDETTDEYLPGMILLGARTAPDEPWIVSRNTGGEVEIEENSVEIAYDFPLLKEFEVKGKFYEKPEQPGVVAWDITIKNRSKQSIEIGELGFPFALNNALDGFPLSDEGMNLLLTERMVVQKFVGGSASYISARRMCGDPPGLLIFPGDETSWEFIHSSPLSLRVSPGWAGVPMAYIHSRATVDREGWEDWLYGHTTVVLEPREEKTYQICFAPITSRHGFETPLAMADYKSPIFRFNIGALIPTNVPAIIEVAGTRPTQITCDAEDAELESDTDEFGGFIVLKKTEPGEARVFVEDMEGRESWCHLMFTPPIADLIQSRATWIMENQIAREGSFEFGILPASNETEEIYESPFETHWGIMSSLADATFFAEKNRLYPNPDQIQVLDDYVEKFLLKRFHKSGQGTFAALLSTWEKSAGIDASRSQVYIAAANFYLTCAELAREQKLSRTSAQYEELAESVIRGMKKFADRDSSVGQALFGASRLAERPSWKEWRKGFLDRFRLPFWIGKQFSTNSIDEIGALGESEINVTVTGSVEQIALTHKSSAPNWWSYGTEVRATTDYESHPTLSDFGEVTPSYTSFHSALALIHWLKRDYTRIDEPSLRMAFAGMLAPWGLVRLDGASTLGFCPDMGSGQRGMNEHTGDVGFALAEYIRCATIFVLPNMGHSFLPFGATIDQYDREGKTFMRIEPWDGVARRIVVRNFNLLMEVRRGQFESVEFDSDLRQATIVVSNPNDFAEQTATITIDGLWGTDFEVIGAKSEITEDGLELTLQIPAAGLKEIEVKVKES